MTPAEKEFLKQRKKLIVSALSVIFVNGVGGSLKKINLLGNEIEFANPNLIPVVLGLVLVYYLVRYLQYAHDVDDKGFKRHFFTRVWKYFEPNLIKREFNKPKSELRLAYPSINEIETIGESRLVFKGGSPIFVFAGLVGKGGGTVMHIHERVFKRELFLPSIRAAIYIGFRTRLVTDYILPLILALLAFLTYVPYVRIQIVRWF